MKRSFKLMLLSMFLICAFVLSSCGRVYLYQNLTEEEVNEILVLLSENGIKVSKKKEIVQNEISYGILVAEKDLVKARSLLLSHNLPRRRELGLTGVYKEKGLIPTPDEQKARYLLAIKGEIINSLERLPQIIDADVVLNIPTKDEFADAASKQEQRPTASVIVKAKPLETGDMPITEAKIQQFVANSVESLNPRDVAVIISYLPVVGAIKPGDVKSIGESSAGSQAAMPKETPSDEIIGLRLDADSKGKLKIYLLIFFLVLVILSAALVVIIVQGSRVRRQLQALQGQVGDNPAIEGRVMNEGPPELQGPPEEGE